eukprot:m.199906 g.199906  ORF g.199906 m.199906 type:complete len:71 (+) comp39581_c1_seq13:2581-2793(+)
MASTGFNSRFEMSPQQTVLFAWSNRNDFVFNHYRHVLKPAGGLWLTVCRHNYGEVYALHFLEFSLRSNSI